MRLRSTRVETAPEMTAALAGAERPDLVLADYNLPEFSGPEALQMVRATGLDLPFIMLSGIMTETTAVESMRAGAHDYVTKQNLARLVPAVERELREVEDRGRKRAVEAALQDSQDSFHRLVEGMPMGLLIADATGGSCTRTMRRKRCSRWVEEGIGRGDAGAALPGAGRCAPLSGCADGAAEAV